MHYGHYEFLVMPFGFCNARKEMNAMFGDQLRKFIIVFLDDILIYRSTLDEHGKNACFVIQTLHDKQLYTKTSKCEFLKKSITYLGHFITKKVYKFMLL